jgi:uncharacterized protein YdeI (YjbR/CyaY-like superfamily)
MHNILSLKTRIDFRKWLLENATTERHCWLRISVKSSDNVILYLDAVEEAICFGWIDSTRKKTQTLGLIQRFSPRTKNSQWSELNKERTRRLIRLGVMTDLGKNFLPDNIMDTRSFIIDSEISQALQSNAVVYANFQSFPELYKRVRIDTIQIKKHQPELFYKRLQKFISNTEKTKMYGNWNDNGKLLSV